MVVAIWWSFNIQSKLINNNKLHHYNNYNFMHDNNKQEHEDDAKLYVIAVKCEASIK